MMREPRFSFFGGDDLFEYADRIDLSIFKVYGDKLAIEFTVKGTTWPDEADESGCAVLEDPAELATELLRRFLNTAKRRPQ